MRMRYSLATVNILALLLLCNEFCEGKSHYEVLGVSKTSSTRVITKKYRELAKKFHPDKNKKDPNAQAKFIELSEAYEVLGNETKRRAYDFESRLGGGSNSVRQSNGNNQFNQGHNFHNFNEEEVFMFRTADGRVFQRSARQQVSGYNSVAVRRCCYKYRSLIHAICLV